MYRWRANELLQAAGISYRLADSGEDQGRLVAVFDDGRSALLADILGHPQPDTANQVHHTVALFRGRGATDEDKLSTLITLAGILEERRQLIKVELVSTDEGALFHIANKFATRTGSSSATTIRRSWTGIPHRSPSALPPLTPHRTFPCTRSYQAGRSSPSETGRRPRECGGQWHAGHASH